MTLEQPADTSTWHSNPNEKTKQNKKQKKRDDPRACVTAAASMKQCHRPHAATSAEIVVTPLGAMPHAIPFSDRAQADAQAVTAKNTALGAS
mmetsp:Transcript_344/g.735  ORF Transcript_344/g.735 Transcript_344/m.735 type:complete len:92 (+) Transcript_344:618-893(+)